MSKFAAELELLPPVVSWVEDEFGRLSEGVIVRELPWFGRRVDLAILDESGETYAFELKLRNNRRAIEQAIYNGLSFNYSYIATASMPGREMRTYAIRNGVGIVFVGKECCELIEDAGRVASERGVQKRLVGKINDLTERRLNV